MPRTRTLPALRAMTDDLIQSLHEVRALGELARAELYWTIRRTAKTRRRAAEMHSSMQRQRALQLYTAPPSGLFRPIPPHAA